MAISYFRYKQFSRVFLVRSFSSFYNFKKGEQFLSACSGSLSLSSRQFSRIAHLEHDYEVSHGYRFHSDSSRTPYFCARIQIMIANAFPVSSIPALLDSVLKSLKCSFLPHLYTFRKQGRGTYAVAYVLCRPYYPNGQTVFKRASHDVFISSSTHKICSPSSPDAVLIHRKNDILSQSVDFFGKKTKAFSGTADYFLVIVKQIKHAVHSFLRRMGLPEKKGFYFFKFREFKPRRRTARIAAALWNDVFSYMETELNQFVEYGSYCGVSLFQPVSALLESYDDILKPFVSYGASGKLSYHSDSHTYKPRLCRLTLYPHIFSDLRDSASVLLMRFRRDIRRLNAMYLEQVPYRKLSPEEETAEYEYWHAYAHSLFAAAAD